MTTPTPHGAPELPIAGYLHTLHMEGGGFSTAFEDEDSKPFGTPGHGFDPDYKVTVEPLVRLSDARAAIQQAAGAVPGPDFWQVLGELEDACERAIHKGYAWHGLDELIERFNNVQRAASPSPLGREAGSSDHLVPCAGGGVIQPLTEVRSAILAYYDALDRREHGGVAQDKAFRRIEQAMEMHWEPQATLRTSPRPDAPTSQINPGSAPREDGHG